MEKFQILRILVFIACVILLLMLFVLWIGFGVGGNFGASSVLLTIVGTFLVLIIPALGFYALHKKDETWMIKFVIGCFVMFLIQLLSTILTGIAWASECPQGNKTGGFWGYFCSVPTAIFVIICIIVFSGTLMGMIFGYMLHREYKDSREGKEEANVYLY